MNWWHAAEALLAGLFGAGAVMVIVFALICLLETETHE